MAKLDKIVEVLENWQKGYKKANKGDKQLGDIRSTLNGGRPLSPSPSLQELSTREIEELRRAWDGKGAMGYEPDFAGYNDVGPKTYQGIPIKDRDLAILKGEVDPYQFVEQPNYGRDIRTNPNVRRGDDRVLPPKNTTNVGTMQLGTDLPNWMDNTDYSIGNSNGVTNSSLLGKRQGVHPGQFSDVPALERDYRGMDIGEQSKKANKGIALEEMLEFRNKNTGNTNF